MGSQSDRAERRYTNRTARREFVHTAAVAVGGLAGIDHLLPAFARTAGGAERAHSGPDRPAVVDLTVGRTKLDVGGRTGHAVTVNGTVPAPLIRLRQGGTAVIRVSNALDEDTSIHWHGVILPNAMDGMPLVTFPACRAWPECPAGTRWLRALAPYRTGPTITAPETPWRRT